MSREFQQAKKIITEFARQRARHECISHLMLRNDFNLETIKLLERRSDEELHDLKALYDETYNKKSSYFAAGAYRHCGE